MQFKTLVDALTHNRSEDRFVGFLNGQDQEKIITFSALYERALGLLYVLQRKGMQQGDYLILNLNDNEKMVDVFWACQLGGIIPVPLAIGISDQHRKKIFNVYQQLITAPKSNKNLNKTSSSAYLYTDRKTLLKLQSSAENSSEVSSYGAIAKHVLLTDDVVDVSEPGQMVEVAPEDVSFIQFSSGSTGSPKGVVLKHRNLMANIDGIQKAAEFTSDDTSLSWMPLTHDMGLIGFHLNPIVCNYNHYIMRTDLFIRRPLYWMTAASDKKANVLCSPNFGYKHFLNAYGRKGQNNTNMVDTDLSHMRLIFNGAEPISVNLCEQFTNEMSKFGLPKNSMFPVYGLAEASLAVSFPAVGTALNVINLQRESLAIGAKAEITPASEKTSTLVGVGTPIPHCKVRISNQQGEELPESTVGHIHIGGQNVTEEIIGDNGAIFFEDGWVNTGDLGFSSEKGIFITGRFKEILFVNGQNYYPHDIEETLQTIPGLEHELELGKVVVTGVNSDKSDLEQVIVFILHKGKLNEFASISTQVKTRINEQFGIEVHYVLPIRKVPKTTSGKVQRSALADMYLDGEFDEVLKELLPVKNVTRQGGGQDNDQINCKTDEPVADEVVNAIKKVCMEALPEKSFSINDSLLELGASSLSLVEIHAGLDELYPDKIDITDLVEHPTIAALAEYIKTK